MLIIPKKARWLQNGVFAYPTEAVFGLGCNPWNAAAVERILAIKRRPMRKGLILIAADFAQLRPFVEPLPAAGMAAILATWPGPNTWLLPVRPQTPLWLCGDRPTLAVRVTAHPLAAALCRQAGMALVSTSANRAGLPPAKTTLEARLRLGRDLDLVVPGRVGQNPRPSTIRDARTGQVIRA